MWVTREPASISSSDSMTDLLRHGPALEGLMWESTRRDASRREDGQDRERHPGVNSFVFAGTCVQLCFRSRGRFGPASSPGGPKGLHRAVFFDLGVETKVYSEAYYAGICDPILDKFAQENTYDLYFLTYIDTPWVEDDLRDKPNERLRMFNAFKDALDKYKRPYIVLKGSKQERLQLATKKIDELLNK